VIPVLYALVAVLAWPGGRDRRPGGSVANGSPLGRYAKLPWLLLWSGMACLMATTPHQAPLTVIAFTTAFAAVAAGVWNRRLIRPALIVAAIAAVVIWVTGSSSAASSPVRPPIRTPGRCLSSSPPRSGRLNGPVVPPARSRPP
jgi:cell division protein FtsW (lipid II flippase)